MNQDPSRFPTIQWLPDIDPQLDEEAVLRLFTQRVEELLRDNKDLLLSSLYRLDVEEDKIQQALRSTDTLPARALAILILDRQKERLKTRQAYKKKDQANWEGL